MVQFRSRNSKGDGLVLGELCYLCREIQSCVIQSSYVGMCGSFVLYSAVRSRVKDCAVHVTDILIKSKHTGLQSKHVKFKV